VKLRVALLALLVAVGVGAAASQANPTNAVLTLSSFSPNGHVYTGGANPKLFYSAGGGQFSVSVTATTNGGITSVDFPNLFGSDPAPAALTSHTYTWVAGDAATPPQTVSVQVSDVDGSSPASFDVAPDVTSPTGATVAVTGGPTFATPAVPLTLGNGSDPGGAGVDASSGELWRASAPLTGGTCGSFGASVKIFGPAPLAASLTDGTVADGNCYQYEYKISDYVGNQSTSPVSAVAKVSTAVPTVTVIAPTEGSGSADQFWNATTKTVWFRPSASGSFTLNATAADSSSGTGITQVAFPDVSSVTGWSGSTGGADTTSPYASPVTYTWTTGAAAPGAKPVIATGGGSLTASDTVTISADSAPPSGQAVTLTGGPWFGASVPLTITGGTDAGSGVDATRSVVERASAALTNGACGTFGTFAAVTLSGNADTSVVSGGCYRYQVKATDNVGNLSVASKPSEDAKVDTTPPTIPTLYFSGFSSTAASGKVVYFRPGGSGSFTVTAASSDPESGVTSYSFPTVSGFTVAGSGPRRTYAFSGSGSAPAGPLSVTATNAAGLSSGTSSFTLVGDGTAPSLTVRCNGGACSKKPYARAVMVTLAAADATSGVGTVRWTSDGTDPRLDHGNAYLRGITVNGVTRLKVRAFDNAGNASPLVSLTVVSRAGRLVFGAPSAVVLGANARYASLRVTSTRRASVRMTMTGTGLKTPARWSFILDPGTSIVRLRLPKGVKHPGTYRIVWTLRSGSGTTTRSTRLTLSR
jgi:hypothetical protein